ncbi:hypothetical protein C4J93_1194 [Pseudomonas sp. R2-37-08W]|nr:hypothetical protein C4J93_1194 [Pseudomonas sp. R2-37-08W]
MPEMGWPVWRSIPIIVITPSIAPDLDALSRTQIDHHHMP